ncbi:RecQ family ATP-dependent DNA helicase [Deinococcus sp. UYEF24]
MSAEQKLIAALQAQGPSLLSDLVIARVMSSERLLKQVAQASGGKILQDGNRLLLPEHQQTGDDLPPVSGLLSGYVIFDLETTSANPEVAEIVELAAVRVRDGQEVDRFQRLVRGPVLSTEVAGLTGISNQMLQEDGEPLEAVLNDFMQWAGSEVLLGHNALKYDLPVLRRAFQAVSLELGFRTVLDSMLLAPLAFARDEDAPEVYQLGALHTRITGTAHDDAHRALDDCRATLRVMNACVERLQAFPQGVAAVLRALPVPEFQLAWAPEPVEIDAYAVRLESLLQADAKRSHVERRDGRNAQTTGELLLHPRPGQERMLDAVALTLRSGGVGVIEAPTGTGKTRGYLYPALLQGRPGHPVVISTHTRQLQDQILGEARDVQAAGFNLSVLALKGQGNYLCPARLGSWLRGKYDPEQQALILPADEARAAALLLLHAQLGEFTALPPAPIRYTSAYQRLTQTVATQRARCGDKCPFHRNCAYYPLYQARARASVVVVNHALLLQSLLQDREEKDEFDGLPLNRVVVDEAHDLGEAAYAALRREVSVQNLRALVNELLEVRPRRLGDKAAARGQELLTLLERQQGSGTLIGRLRQQLQEAPNQPHLLIPLAEEWLARQPLLPRELVASYLRWRDRTATVQGFLSGALIEAQKRGETELTTAILRLTPRLADLQEQLTAWHARLRPFAMQYGEGSSGFGYTVAVTLSLRDTAEFRAVRDLGRQILPALSALSRYALDFGKYPAVREEAVLLSQRLEAAHGALGGLLDRDPGEDVYAVSASDDNGSLWSVPLWLHARLAPVWATLTGLVLTSATLRIPGSDPATGEGDVNDFGLFQEELGLPEARFLSLPAVLPYEKGHVFLTNHLPLTRQPGFATMAGQELAILSPQLPHRHLHILTARARQEGVGKEFGRRQVPVMSSVTDGAERVVRDLSRRETGTALGAAGFMQGVDIRDLSVVSLDRLPFPIPDVILSQQRVALGDFEQFWNRVYLPRAVLKFVQAFGRLVRDDRERVGNGAFVLWDKRLPVSHYQARFLGALPVPPQNVHRLADRKAMYGALGQLFGLTLDMPPLQAPKQRRIEELTEAVRDSEVSEWPALLEAGLRDLFEIPDAKLREGQLEGLCAALQGRDVLTVLPTGSGKSVIFQLPALLTSGYTLVISPLVALMQDQVTRLQQLGLPAAGLWGGLSRGEQLSYLTDTERGDIKLLYVAPERVRRSVELQELLRRQPPARVVYDEAHCLTEWGHDFRPDYLKVSETLKGWGLAPPISAFTATATPEVQRQLRDLLGLRDPEHKVLPVERPNLHYLVQTLTKVRRDQTLVDLVLGLRRTETGKSGRVIVYCGSRDGTERVAALLRELNVKAEAYHAGLSPAIRTELVERFQDKEVQVMVATNAFGMGVDAPDIRLVVHYDPPLSLEAYVQEAGRAGRDGEPAYAVLFKSGRLGQRARNLISRSYPAATEVEALLRNISKKDYPTEKELSDDDLDISRLPTVLHLLEEAGVVEYSFVPGLYRVFALYGVQPPQDPQIAALLEITAPVNLTRHFGKGEALALQERLHHFARDGVLGVTALAPALDIYVKRWDLKPYEAKRRQLIDKKTKRFEEFERFLGASACREYQLHGYFDQERRGRFSCGRCEVCAPGASYPWSGHPPKDLSDIWNPERELLRLMTYFRDRPRGRGTLIRLLMGEDGAMRNGTFQSYGVLEKTAPGYGLLKHLDKTRIEQAIAGLEGRRCVQATVTDTYTVLALTDKGLQEAAKWTRI